VTPLPPPVGPGGLVGWRLDQAGFKDSWDSGEGAYRFGGRWNRKGKRVVYAALDPATAILEVAVHKGFAALDTVTHVLTSFRLQEKAPVHVVQPDDVPNPSWLRPGLPSAGQQAFGDELLAGHALVLIPSVVSSHSWNLLIAVPAGRDAYLLSSQERFALDTRLSPPPS
jgi:RES domain-containing protein